MKVLKMEILLIAIILLMAGIALFQFFVIKGSWLRNAALEERNAVLLNELLEEKKPKLRMRPLSGKYGHLAAQVLITRDGLITVPFNPEDRVLMPILELDPNVVEGFSPLKGHEMNGFNPEFFYLRILGAEYLRKKGQVTVGFPRVDSVSGFHSV